MSVPTQRLVMAYLWTVQRIQRRDYSSRCEYTVYNDRIVGLTPSC